MAAPERFAEKSDSSCTAGTVHTWPFATNLTLGPDVSFWGKAEVPFTWGAALLGL
jgi:hypothetical protein